MTGKRVVFTGGTGKAGRHVLPHLKSRGYDLLNVDLKPFDHPGISTLIADQPFRSRQAAGGAGRRRAFCRDTASTDRAG